ncbi:PEP-CTERM sorting domain-containing protein [Armatimonas sp.]|uniref:PEP-CTERM sorting domain-containing protein n=1 Tax=Armatimonas sp. TaxID=1872638 RepID=UPI003751276A
MRLSLRGVGSVLAVGLLACLPQTASAQFAFSSVGAVAGNQNFGGTLGQFFTISSAPLTVSALGAFDGLVAGFGAGTTITVGISDATYTTIFTQTTFTQAAPGVPGAGSFTFKGTGPTVLPVGNYLLFAYGYNATDMNFNSGGNPSSFTLNTFSGTVSYGTSAFSGTANSLPTINEPIVGRYGAASFVATSPVVPEPGTLALLGLGMMAGVVARRRRA